MAKDRIVAMLEKELKHAENAVTIAIAQREKVRAALNAWRKEIKPVTQQEKGE